MYFRNNGMYILTSLEVRWLGLFNAEQSLSIGITSAKYTEAISTERHLSLKRE